MNRSPHSLQHIAAIRRSLFTTPEERNKKRMARAQERIEFLNKILSKGRCL